MPAGSASSELKAKLCVSLHGRWSGDICLHPHSMSSFEVLMPLHILNMTSNNTHSVWGFPHTLKERRQRRRVFPCEWGSFLSWGQVHNDPAKMDREIVLWSDPRTQIGGGRSVCVCILHHNWPNGTSVLARWVGALGPCRAKGKDKGKTPPTQWVSRSFWMGG